MPPSGKVYKALRVYHNGAARSKKIRGAGGIKYLLTEKVFFNTLYQ